MSGTHLLCTSTTSPTRRTRARLRVALVATAAAVALPLLAVPASAMNLPTTPPTSPTAGPTLPPPLLPTPVLPTPTLTPTPPPTPTLPPLPVPVPVPVLPEVADVVPSYQSQRSCDPAAKPGVEAYVRMVLQTYRIGRNGGIVRGCGLGSTSEHKEGRAFDYMLNVNVPAERAAGDSLTGWLTGLDDAGVHAGNARRLGVMYVIWNRRIWSASTMGTGWRSYSGPSPHTDHVHTSFSWDGAQMRTSWWSGRTVNIEDRGPCRVYAGQPAPVYTGPQLLPCSSILLPAPASAYSIVWPGQSSSVVKVAQAELGVPADGVFGFSTRSTLMGWQRKRALPVTGVLDKPTWNRLVPPPVVPPAPTTTVATPVVPEVVLPTTALTPFMSVELRPGSRGTAVKALQRALKLSTDGVFGVSTTSAVAAAQTRARLRGTGVVDAATWVAVQRQAYPLLDYRATTLRRFSTGPAVYTLEKALAMASVDTSFGPATQSAVRAVQLAAGLPQTTIVDDATWVAVEARAFPLGAVRPSAKAVARATALTPFRDLTVRRGATGLVVTAIQRSLGITADGLFGAGTLSSVRAFQLARRLPVTGVVDARTWTALELVAYPLVPHRTTVLRPGAKGAAVSALQKALRSKVDGTFAASLATAVKAAQVRAKLTPTGIVTTSTWVAVEKAAYPLGVKRW